MLQTVAALQAAGQPISLSIGPVDKSAPYTGGNVTTAVTSESEQSSDEHVAQPDEPFSQVLAQTEKPKYVWKPVRDRSYILSDVRTLLLRQLDVFLFYCR